MTSFDIPTSLETSFDNRHNPMGRFIDEADRVDGHVIADGDNGFKVVSDFEVTFRKLEPLYSAGKGFTFPSAA